MKRRPAVSLQATFILGAVLVITLTMAGLIGIVEHQQRVAIIDEVQQRSMVLARSLAGVSTGPLLLYNFTALEQNVARTAQEADVAYAIVLDAEGRVAASSLNPGHVGTEADDPVGRRAAATSVLLLQETALPKTGERIYEVAVPVEVQGQRWGTVRVAVSQERMEAAIAGTRRDLALLAFALLLGGAGAAALVARRIVGPIRALAAGAAAISRGDLAQRIEVQTANEIGQLARAFNHMASQLVQQRTELDVRFAELSDLKSYTDHILGSLTSGIVTLDLDGCVVTLNPAAEALTGCRLAEVRGRPCREAFAVLPDLADLLDYMRGPRPPGAVSFITLARPGAAPAQVELTAAPLRGADGRDLGVVAVLRDLTAVRQLEEQLRRSDRLAALGTLAAGLAHEIKNPLTSLLTFTRHLSRRFGDERFRQRFQNVVPRELERINGIVDSVLRLSRPARLATSTVRVPELLDQVLELYGDPIDARHLIVVREYAPVLPTIEADREQLYQAMVNLVSNAIDATPDGGTLTLRAVSGEPDEALDAPGRRRGTPRVRIEIQDTGPGIPPAQAAQVFNPFFTTKPSGTGLGLAIVHKVVEDHGGTVGLRVGPRGGTTFTVELPLTTARPVIPVPDRPKDAGLPGLLS